MSATTTLPATTDETFARDVAPGTGLVAVEFTAAWCPPCRVFGPLVEEAAQAYAGRLRVYQMDADVNLATVARHDVRSLPTLVVFRDGAPVDRVVGAVPRGMLRDRLERVLGD